MYVFHRIKHFTFRSFIALLAAVSMVAVATVRADEDSAPTSTLDEAQLIQRIKEEVIKELLEAGVLREQVEIGIQEYVKKQREAQVAARTEQERLAAERAKNVRRVSVDRDHVYGNPEAEISLIEYSDFECPYCKRFHATAKKLVDESDGKVNWVYRHFPLSFHNPGAQKQAEASECAAELGGSDAFWKLTDAIYERTKSGGKGFPLTQLVPLAEEIGLDQNAFRTCLDSGRHSARVKEDFDEGTQSGITGTPGNIFLNNKTGAVSLKAGALPFAAIKAEVDALLN